MSHRLLRIVFSPLGGADRLCRLNKWAWSDSCWSSKNIGSEGNPLFIDSVWPKHWGKACARLPLALSLAPMVAGLAGIFLIAAPLFYLCEWTDNTASPAMRRFYRRVYGVPFCGDSEEPGEAVE